MLIALLHSTYHGLQIYVLLLLLLTVFSSPGVPMSDSLAGEPVGETTVCAREAATINRNTNDYV